MVHSSSTFHSRHMASYSSFIGDWRLRRGYPTLGPLFGLKPAALSSHPSTARPARYTIASTRFQRVVPGIPSTWSHPRIRVQRPHDALLGARTSRRRVVCVQRRRRETPRGDRRGRRRGGVRAGHRRRAHGMGGRRRRTGRARQRRVRRLEGSGRRHPRIRRV